MNSDTQQGKLLARLFDGHIKQTLEKNKTAVEWAKKRGLLQRKTFENNIVMPIRPVPLRYIQRPVPHRLGF